MPHLSLLYADIGAEERWVKGASVGQGGKGSMRGVCRHRRHCGRRCPAYRLHGCCALPPGCAVSGLADSRAHRRRGRQAVLLGACAGTLSWTCHGCHARFACLCLQSVSLQRTSQHRRACRLAVSPQQGARRGGGAAAVVWRRAAAAGRGGAGVRCHQPYGCAAGNTQCRDALHGGER